MENCDKIVLRNTEPTSLEPTDPARVRLTNAERQKNFRQRRTKDADRMKRIIEKTERLNRTIRGVQGSEVTIPLNLFSDDVETSLDNLQQHFEHTEQARETARTGTKTQRGAKLKK